nr:xanthine dehydrogenase family protein molybdopterin-binding subunit [Ramlibacter aurantiacus]
MTGRGRYIDDITLPRMAHAALVLSPYAHARIRSIDTAQALAAPGVLAVLTGQDARAEGLGGMPPLFMPEDMGGPKGHRTYRPLLATDRARCVGDRVAFVVAETPAQARDAAELVEVDYEPLDAVASLEDAMRADAPLVWDEAPGNRCCMVMYGDAVATDAAFASAPHVTRLKLQNNRLSANSIEPRGAIGLWNEADEQYTLHTSSQNPHGARSMLCSHVFKVPETTMRVISPDVGGGFGMKADAYPEDGLVLWASRRCGGRPVKWIPTRSESLATDNHGRDQLVEAEMALDRAGRILGVRARSAHAFGAYVVSAAVAPLNFAIRFIPSVYDVPAFHGVNVGVFTHTSPTGPYRGAGRPEAAYVMERLLDQAANELGLEPAAIRERNFIRPEQMPYATHTGFVYDSGDFGALLDRCLDLSDEAGLAARKADSRSRGLLRGRGIGLFIEQGGIFNDQMSLRFDPGGTVTIVAGTHSHGQGHATVFAQLVSEWLGVPFETVRYVQGDTDKVPFGRGTYAARSSMIGGCALRMAADRIIEQALPVAARMTGNEPAGMSFDRGIYTGANGKQVTLAEVARAHFIKAGPMAQLGAGLQATGTWNTDPPNFPNGCHICEVEIDPETGHVHIDRYSAVDDIGRALNPMICKGQIQGGVAQGIGQALHEHLVYDRESGQLVTGSFMDYGMPRADDLPSFDLRFAKVPCTTNPLGVKAVGEAGTIGAPPAVMNAVLDALRPLGIHHLDMPATPLKVWTAIREASDMARTHER